MKQCNIARKIYTIIKSLKLKFLSESLKSVCFPLAVWVCMMMLLPIGQHTVYAEEERADVNAGSDMEDGQPGEETALAEDDPIIVVIDPGHGGENLGGEYEDYTEKEMTIVVANAMKEELEKYEGITVYLTRNGDQDLDLEERCEFAESVNADFMFCLHFNLSEYHTLFGAECWVSAFG